MVNHYKLQLKFTCGNHVTEGSLSVNVHRDLSHIQCAGQFASPGEAVSRGGQAWPEQIFPDLHSGQLRK